MRSLFELSWKFLKEEDGPTAVEYAIMIVLIIMVVFVAVQFIGQEASTTFSTIGASIGP